MFINTIMSSTVGKIFKKKLHVVKRELFHNRKKVEKTKAFKKQENIFFIAE